MPKEGDRKTTKGLLKSRDKVEDILGTLANIDPETEDVQIEVRRARGIGEAFRRQLFRLDEVVQHGEDEEDEEREEPPKKPTAADNATSFFAPPEVLAEKLAAAGRPLPASFLSTWTPDARAAALKWCDNRAGGGSAPIPEVLAKRFLEDLDLAERVLDRVELLVWIGFEGAGRLEAVRQGLDAPAYATADWDRFAPWAVAVHRRDRGERGVEMPEVPDEVLPAPERLAAIKESLAEEGEASLEDLIAKREFDDTPDTYLAVQVLLQAGEIVKGDDGPLHAARPDLVEAEDKLLQRAFSIASRGGRAAAQEAPAAEGEPIDTGTPELAALPSYAQATILDPREEDPEGDADVRVVIRFSGPERRADQITGVSILEEGKPYQGVRDNSALAYLEDEETIRRTRESWEDIGEAANVEEEPEEDAGEEPEEGDIPT